jgi:hypothetical protein
MTDEEVISPAPPQHVALVLPDEQFGAVHENANLAQMPDDATAGKEAAALIWADDPTVPKIPDPRTPAFAHAVIDALSNALSHAPGAMKRAFRTAAKSATGLNVQPLQGIVEVIQNADDLLGTEVRFALRDGDKGRQLLIVHNGQPVTCQHVLAMVIPYFTTKEEEADQRGRFGIGLKTLGRIAPWMSIHSEPYHFSSDQVSLARVAAEPAIPDFYDPARDTMIVLRLKPDFDEISLKTWFDGWDDDGLIFLSTVRRFLWHGIGEGTLGQKFVTPGPWQIMEIIDTAEGTEEISRREVGSGDKVWAVYRARVRVKEGLHPANKARSETTRISIAALRGASGRGHLHIGFRTRVPVTLPVSIDGQFDPSTAREELVDNDWNTWLIKRSGAVIADVARGLLATRPDLAWPIVPLATEAIGNEDDTWLRGTFDEAFEDCRATVAAMGLVEIGGKFVPLDTIAYEAPRLTDFLTSEDVERLKPGARALPLAHRDPGGRWRDVLSGIGVAHKIGTAELLAGFGTALFADKPASWWVEAAGILTQDHPTQELFSVPFWLTAQGRAVECQKATKSARRLVFGGEPSAFAERWDLLDRLHPAYGSSAQGEAAIKWLSQHAAFTAAPSASEELEAFAERFAKKPVEIDDQGLREIRDRFDYLPESAADGLGGRVGTALLLDGIVYKANKPRKVKVSPHEAYLPKTLDGEYPHWPVAAGTLPGIQWIAARYDEKLATGSGRGERRRGEEGRLTRGPRRFLMLLGAESAPRLALAKGSGWAPGTRGRELRAIGASEVQKDLTSPDLDRVLASLPKMRLKDRKVCSPALLRALSRNWARVYAPHLKVVAGAWGRKYYNDKGNVSAQWLVRLMDTAWVAVGKGDLARPSTTVIRSPDTQAVFPGNRFVVGVGPGDISAGIARDLGIKTDIRGSDLLDQLVKIREAEVKPEDASVLHIYRNLAKFCPRAPGFSSAIDDVPLQELRRRFSDGKGLIYTSASEWKRPAEMLRGNDIFHDRKRFVPGGPGCAALWVTLGVPEPSLDDCITFCRKLARDPYNNEAIGKLLDVYRYIEARLGNAERRHKEKLRGLPLVCGDGWRVDRPIFLVEENELREQLAAAEPQLHFWTPPCDIRELPRLIAMLGLARTAPILSVTDNRKSARDQGESIRDWFECAVDHLSDELARNDIATREKLSIGWDALPAMPLFVYDYPPAVTVTDPVIAPSAIKVCLKALLQLSPLELHIWIDALAEREHGGRAIASLFPPEVRRKIDAEWVVAWLAGKTAAATGVRLASDQAHLEALQEEAAKIDAAPKMLIKVSHPAAQKKGAAEPRRLKDSVGIIAKTMVLAGGIPVVGAATKPNLSLTAPNGDPRGGGGRGSSSGADPRPKAFDTRDVEQVGWEVANHVLNAYDNKDLVDFRHRHGVGADGAFDWRRFVELKAFAGGPPSSIEMSPAEYERAKRTGTDYILAVVSGLETGEPCQVRLIFDPVRRASHTPTSGVRFHSLNEASSILVSFDEGQGMATPIGLNRPDGVEADGLISEAGNADPPLITADDQTPKQPDNGQPGETQGSGISFFITQAQKLALRERGFADEEIRNMTPSAAHKLLAAVSS